jgi:hypothetical protein
VIKTLALIQDNKVVNTVVSDENCIHELGPDYIVIDDITPQPSIGWSYENGVFTAPPPTPPPPPPPPQTVFTKYQFRSRFTLAELVATDNFASSSTLTDVQKATLNTITKNFDVADSIDVTNSATIQGVEYLVTAGLLTQDRATEILK